MPSRKKIEEKAYRRQITSALFDVVKIGTLVYVIEPVIDFIKWFVKKTNHKTFIVVGLVFGVGLSLTNLISLASTRSDIQQIKSDISSTRLTDDEQRQTVAALVQKKNAMNSLGVASVKGAIDSLDTMYAKIFTWSSANDYKQATSDITAYATGDALKAIHASYLNPDDVLGATNNNKQSAFEQAITFETTRVGDDAKLKQLITYKTWLGSDTTYAKVYSRLVDVTYNVKTKVVTEFKLDNKTYVTDSY